MAAPLENDEIEHARKRLAIAERWLAFVTQHQTVSLRMVVQAHEMVRERREYLKALLRA